MTDVFTKEKRSSIMSANRGSDTRATERRLRAMLAAAGISGWRLNARDVYGKPDFVFDDQMMAIFVDGCFWHGCKCCRSIPRSNRAFWQDKIEKNKRRDRQVTRKLRRDGWTVIRFWEHQVRRDPQECVLKVKDALSPVMGS